MRAHLNLLVDRSRAGTITEQIVDQIREAIRSGRVPAGMRLPSSRRLADQLGVGRNTVIRAYETLVMECFVESRPASGMIAVQPIRSRPPPQAALRAPPAVVSTASSGHLSIDFAPGRTNASLFPLKTWRRLLQTCLSQGGAIGLSQPVDPMGLASLRAAIANHVAAFRGLATDPGRIVIVGSIPEALALTIHLFVVPGARVAIECPGPAPAAAAYRAAGASLYPVPVDECGLVPHALPDEMTALLYATPSHQVPTGHMLPPGRRAAVIAWARAQGSIIIEDDTGCEIRYEGGAPPAICADAPDCTVYVGAFAHALGPGLGLAYMVVPQAYLEAARTAREAFGGGPGWLEQAAMAEFLRSGSYVSHLARMRIAYRERRDQLLLSLRRHFGDAPVSGAGGGLHVLWHLPPGVPDAPTIAALARRVRVGVYPAGSTLVFDNAGTTLSRRCMMLGYAALSPRQIEQGIARLSDAVDDALDLHRIGLGDLLTHRSEPSQPGGSKPALRFRQRPALPPRPLASQNSPRNTRGLGTVTPAISALYCYPVKGLSAQPLQTVAVRAGAPFPFDRVMALARPGHSVNPEQPAWAKKGLFVMLMLEEQLARVRTAVDESTLLLTACDDTGERLRACLAEPEGRGHAEAFFHGLVPNLPSPPRLVRAVNGGHFMDKPDNVISLINLATLRQLEQRWGVTLDPLRFRANIYIDGVPPWAEFDWVGHDIRLGDAVFHADRRNGRCGATNVDPATGRRDLDIPRSLRATFGHKDLGIYLLARNDATLAVGGALEAPGIAPSAPPVPETTARPAMSPAFICAGCYYIYDPAILGTDSLAFADLPYDWRCADCGTDKGKFRPHLR